MIIRVKVEVVHDDEDVLIRVGKEESVVAPIDTEQPKQAFLNQIALAAAQADTMGTDAMARFREMCVEFAENVAAAVDEEPG